MTSFHELYSKYSGDVYRFSYWLTGNPDDAHDITSETFVRVWTTIGEPKMESVKAYLFAIARNLHRKQWRRSARTQPLDDSTPLPMILAHDSIETRDELQRTLAAMQSLSEIDRTLLLLRAEQELSYEDIARVTGLAVAAAKVRVFRARLKLTKILQQNKGISP